MPRAVPSPSAVGAGLTAWGPNQIILPGDVATLLGPLSGHTNLPAEGDALVQGPSGEELGRSSAYGDWNGDGKADRIIGATTPYWAPGPGRLYGILGGNLDSGAVADVADLIIEGTSPHDRLGIAVVTGDFNGDGSLDIAATSYRDPTTALTEPRARCYIFFSPEPGTYLADEADVMIEAPVGSDLNSVANAGDTNGDGVDDLIVVSMYADDPTRPGESDHGAAFLILGPL